MESLFSKVIEISSFLQLTREIKQVLGMFQKVAFLEIARGPLQTGFGELQYAVSNPSKNEFLTKFLKDVLRNYQELIHNAIPYQKLINLKIAASSLACF